MGSSHSIDDAVMLPSPAPVSRSNPMRSAHSIDDAGMLPSTATAAKTHDRPTSLARVVVKAQPTSAAQRGGRPSSLGPPAAYDFAADGEARALVAAPAAEWTDVRDALAPEGARNEGLYATVHGLVREHDVAPSPAWERDGDGDGGGAEAPDLALDAPWLFSDYDGVVHGTFGTDELLEWYSTGDLHPETPVVHAAEGEENIPTGKWVTLEEVAQFAGHEIVGV